MDPVFLDLTKDVFTLVAEGVTNGSVSKKSNIQTTMLYYYKETGGAAPANDAELGVRMFQDGTDTEQISHSSSIDVYVMPVNEDVRVRVDL
ncbi:hypothetical protein KAR91_15060 [Candidatus Pacearchaeota archaeon]|nr:hypothetical protein [Candidatus Pacearchaeota archaeon]